MAKLAKYQKNMAKKLWYKKVIITFAEVMQVVDV